MLLTHYHLLFSGFRCWGFQDVDINDELAHIANAAELGVEGPNGIIYK
jgi:hypothetical protein